MRRFNGIIFVVIVVVHQNRKFIHNFSMKNPLTDEMKRSQTTDEKKTKHKINIIKSFKKIIHTLVVWSSALKPAPLQCAVRDDARDGERDRKRKQKTKWKMLRQRNHHKNE